MRFGPVPLSEVTPHSRAVLAHSTVLSDGTRYRKGTLIDEAVKAALMEDGTVEVIAALPEADDVTEDEAAGAMASALAGANISLRVVGTGRVNLHAEKPGVLTFPAGSIHAANGVDPALTVATLMPMERVEAGQMVATVKVIPFAVPGEAVQKVSELLVSGRLAVAPFRAGMKSLLIQTELPSVKPAVLEKTRLVTAQRLEAMGGVLASEARTAHQAEPLARALAGRPDGTELVIVFGASAMTDEDDVIPQAIRLAGGTVRRVGMPVDPGNLIVIGSIDGIPVIGAPGCARSAKLNGFDWVIERIAAGIEVTAADVTRMGVGGLLKEIPSRPRPREDV